VNTGQHCRAILKLMNKTNIHVSNVNFRQQDRTSLRLTHNINIQVLNAHVSNVNIRQQHKDFLRLTNNLNMKVLNIPVPNVNIKASVAVTVADIKYLSCPKRSGNMKLYFCHLRLILGKIGGPCSPVCTCLPLLLVGG
jgi:hypothetical protein